jgi:hypothetical protein
MFRALSLAKESNYAESAYDGLRCCGGRELKRKFRIKLPSLDRAMNKEPKAQADDLKGLAQAKCGKLSAAEEMLLDKVPTGQPAICPDCDGRGYNPKEADRWGPARQVRAELVAWLCTNEEARRQIHPRGMVVAGADITGPLDLSFLNIPFRLAHSPNDRFCDRIAFA